MYFSCAEQENGCSKIDSNIEYLSAGAEFRGLFYYMYLYEAFALFQLAVLNLYIVIGMYLKRRYKRVRMCFTITYCCNTLKGQILGSEEISSVSLHKKV